MEQYSSSSTVTFSNTLSRSVPNARRIFDSAGVAANLPSPLTTGCTYLKPHFAPPSPQLVPHLIIISQHNRLFENDPRPSQNKYNIGINNNHCHQLRAPPTLLTSSCFQDNTDIQKFAVNNMHDIISYINILTAVCTTGSA